MSGRHRRQQRPLVRNGRDDLPCANVVTATRTAARSQPSRAGQLMCGHGTVAPSPFRLLLRIRHRSIIGCPPPFRRRRAARTLTLWRRVDPSALGRARSVLR
jgi:hypothetical protein